MYLYILETGVENISLIYPNAEQPRDQKYVYFCMWMILHSFGSILSSILALFIQETFPYQIFDRANWNMN